MFRTAPSVTEPVAFVHAGRDLDCYMNTHSRPFFDALSSTDKTFFDFPHRLHYFEPEGDEDPNAGALEQMAKLVPWLQKRCPA